MAWTGRGSTRAWRTLRAQILARDPQCQLRLPGICTWHSVEVDHVINVAAGGTDEPGNLRGVCPHCHAERTKAQAAAGRRARTQRGRRTPDPHPGAISPGA